MLLFFLPLLSTDVAIVFVPGFGEAKIVAYPFFTFFVANLKKIEGFLMEI